MFHLCVYGQGVVVAARGPWGRVILDYVWGANATKA